MEISQYKSAATFRIMTHFYMLSLYQLLYSEKLAS